MVSTSNLNKNAVKFPRNSESMEILSGWFFCLEAPPPLFVGGAREALQPEAGLALSAPRGQTLSGTVHAPTPTCIACPSARSLLQDSLTAYMFFSNLAASSEKCGAQCW